MTTIIVGGANGGSFSSLVAGAAATPFSTPIGGAAAGIAVSGLVGYQINEGQEYLYDIWDLQ